MKIKNVTIVKSKYDEYLLSSEEMMKQNKIYRVNGRCLHTDFKDLVQNCSTINTIHVDSLIPTTWPGYFSVVIDNLNCVEDIPEKYPEYLLML